uniref:Uncharacterized protein n=1 Tax=Haptolina brevifila TaxID=156173 RepID=A0A7S2BBN9_9EUKA
MALDMSSNATDVYAVPDNTASLVASTLQAAVFLFLGPFVCIYGPSIIHIVTLIRSLFAMNYLAYIQNAGAVNKNTAFSVFTDQVALLAAGTLALTIASLRGRKLMAYSSGAVLGMMVATPLVALMRESLYFGTVGCTAYGEKTEIFPEGEPVGCDHDSQAFQGTFQGSKATFVVIVTVFAIMGSKTLGFSISMMGSTMIISGSLGIVRSIILQTVNDQDVMQNVISTFTAIELPVTYSLSFAGYVIQWMILKRKDDLRYTSPELYVQDTDEITKLKEELKAMKPEEQTSFIGFFKTVFKRDLKINKIAKKVKQNYVMNATSFTPYRQPEFLPRQPDEMKTMPFRLFRFFISGKWDDRFHKADMMLKNLILEDISMLQEAMKMHAKALVVKRMKGLLASKKQKVGTTDEKQNVGTSSTNVKRAFSAGRSSGTPTPGLAQV